MGSLIPPSYLNLILAAIFYCVSTHLFESWYLSFVSKSFQTNKVTKTSIDVCVVPINVEQLDATIVKIYQITIVIVLKRNKV